jgi:hypothetical protein
MKKSILTLLMILFSVGFSIAQETENAEKTVYCELVGTGKLFSTKVNVVVDYGEERRFFEAANTIEDEDGGVKDFNSMVDALNYMGERGWVFVQAYTVSTSNSNVYHWLLKKTVEDNE